MNRRLAIGSALVYGVEQRFSACYETLSSLQDSDQISHSTQHSAFGCVLG